MNGALSISRGKKLKHYQTCEGIIQKYFNSEHVVCLANWIKRSTTDALMDTEKHNFFFHFHLASSSQHTKKCVLVSVCSSLVGMNVSVF